MIKDLCEYILPWGFLFGLRWDDYNDSNTVLECSLKHYSEHVKENSIKIN